MMLLIGFILKLPPKLGHTIVKRRGKGHYRKLTTKPTETGAPNAE